MFKIESKNDLGLAYILLNDRRINGRANAEKNKQHIIDLKREIRSFVHRPCSSTVLVKDYGMDGYIIRFPLPESICSKEAANEYFMSCCYIEPYYSYYDCTGRPFTSWYKLYKKDGRFWAYHSVSYDV